MQGLGFTAELELFTHQSDYGALGSELCGTEQRPDEAVDLLLLRVVFVIISRNLRFLRQTPEKKRMKSHRFPKWNHKLLLETISLFLNAEV